MVDGEVVSIIEDWRNYTSHIHAIADTTPAVLKIAENDKAADDAELAAARIARKQTNKGRAVEELAKTAAAAARKIHWSSNRLHLVI